MEPRVFSTLVDRSLFYTTLLHITSSRSGFPVLSSLTVVLELGYLVNFKDLTRRPRPS
jgi:hypothetical protein